MISFLFFLKLSRENNVDTHTAVLVDGCVVAMDVVTSRAVVEKFFS
jgi:hypothetical protein